MRPDIREAILRGVAGAAETHDAFRSRDKHEDGLSAVDVFAIIEELQIPLSFKPFDGLLGACVRVNSAQVGILVTTQRDLHMQRFTAAHELGHFVLEHEGSLDREVRVPGHTDNRDLREVEADAFAAELLMPKWLVRAVAERRGWWADEALQDPETVYQLSLRLGLSYEATCWGLASHQYIPVEAARTLVGDGKQLKKVKQSALQGTELDDPWADVWLLTEDDHGARLQAGPNDVFVFDLQERAAAGFRWDVSSATEHGFTVLDDSSAFDETVVGGPATRRVVLQSPGPGDFEVDLPLSRSFAPSQYSKALNLSISTTGTRRTLEAPTTDSAPTTLH